MGLLKIVFRVVALVVLVVIGLGAFLYFSDYDAKATVTDRGSDAQGDFVTVTPKLLPGYHYTYHFTSSDDQYAPYVCKGYNVDFHVQTHKMRVTTSSGTVVYDSQQQPGIGTLGAALRCSALGQG